MRIGAATVGLVMMLVAGPAQAGSPAAKAGKPGVKPPKLVPAKPDKVKDVTEVRAATTPGKPMELAKPDEAAETIVVHNSGSKVTIKVARNVGKAYQEGKGELTAAEWRSLTAIVAAQRLRSWKPLLSKDAGKAIDYSTTSFQIKGDTTNQQSWSQPVSNGAGPSELATRLGQLAKAKVPAVRLFYFGD